MVLVGTVRVPEHEVVWASIDDWLIITDSSIVMDAPGTEVLAERAGVKEHPSHVCHRGDIPTAHVPIEDKG